MTTSNSRGSYVYDVTYQCGGCGHCWNRLEMEHQHTPTTCEVCQRVILDRGTISELWSPKMIERSLRQLTEPQRRLVENLATGGRVCTSYRPVSRLLTLGLARIRASSFGDTVLLTRKGQAVWMWIKYQREETQGKE